MAGLFLAQTGGRGSWEEGVGVGGGGWLLGGGGGGGLTLFRN